MKLKCPHCAEWLNPNKVKDDKCPKCGKDLDSPTKKETK